MEQKKDIFDKLMSLPGLNIFEPFYKKYKEVLLYLLFGGLTSVVSIIAYAYFNVAMGLNELIANVISWIIAVTFAFVTNRIWVFAVPARTMMDFFGQMLSFYGGRVVTLALEEIILYIFISKLEFPSLLIKIIAQVVVIILNYVISKLIVFRKK